MLVSKTDSDKDLSLLKSASEQKSLRQKSPGFEGNPSELDDGPESLPVSLNKPLKSRFETESIETLLSLINRGRINLQPEYQRENDVWSLRRQQRLIESILMGIVIPAIYLVERESHEEVVDGLQRLTTIRRFVSNEFSLADDSQIAGTTQLDSATSPKITGKSFNQLSDEVKNHILLTRIPLIRVTLDRDNAFSDIIHETFARLQCGIPLNAIEVIQASYTSPFMLKLKEIAKKPVILQYFGISNKRARSLGHLLTMLLLHRKEFKDNGSNIYSQIKDLCASIIKAGPEGMDAAIRDIEKIVAAVQIVDDLAKIYLNSKPKDKALLGFFGADPDNLLDTSLCTLRRTSLVLHCAKDKGLASSSTEDILQNVPLLAKQVLRIQDLTPESIHTVAHSKARGVASYKLLSLIAFDLEQEKNLYVH
ncbi:MAG: DUF262 domain-containing protein [Proteobacteria bacterium]|nr:DUF262 domain-containing protein [Pseudomonadota bacterium]